MSLRERLQRVLQALAGAGQEESFEGDPLLLGVEMEAAGLPSKVPPERRWMVIVESNSQGTMRKVTFKSSRIAPIKLKMARKVTLGLKEFSLRKLPPLPPEDIREVWLRDEAVMFRDGEKVAQDFERGMVRVLNDCKHAS